MDLLDYVRELTAPHQHRAITALTCENETRPTGATNTGRPLTHSSDCAREGLAMKATRTCSIDGCDRTHEARGLCRTHYERWRRTGSARAAQPVRSFAPGSTCSIDGCDHEHYARGWCKSHYDRWWLTGSPREDEALRSDEPSTTYNAVHWRIVARRGPAYAQVCVDCGNQSAEWSYNHSGIDEVEGWHARPPEAPTWVCYSTNIDQYEPRCSGCHRRFDAAHRADHGEPPR